MPKEKSINPVQAHNKSLKRAEQKKTKAAVAAQRQDRLSKRDPNRLERQIASLQALASSGDLKPKDKETLASLERDLAAVRKARGRAGIEDKPQHAHTGKRARSASSGSDTDPEVRRIPMPRDTPPPIPRKEKKREEPKEAQITYSSAPVMRDLKKEATGAKFAPAQVKRNIQKAKGQGGLVEEEEWDRLEKAGYIAGGGDKESTKQGSVSREDPAKAQGVQMEEVEDDGT